MQHKCDEEDIFKEVKSTKFERTNRGNQQSEISLFAQDTGNVGELTAMLFSMEQRERTHYPKAGAKQATS